MRGEGGVVLVAVLLLSAVTWGVLAALISASVLQHRLLQAAHDHRVAEGLAGAYLDEALEAASAAQRSVGSWPSEPPAGGAWGRCTLEPLVAEAAGNAWLIEVRAGVGGVRLTRSGSTHAAD